MIDDLILILLLLLWPAALRKVVRAIQERSVTITPRIVCQQDREYLVKAWTYSRETNPVNYWACVGALLVWLTLIPFLACVAAEDLWHRLI